MKKLCFIFIMIFTLYIPNVFAFDIPNEIHNPPALVSGPITYNNLDGQEYSPVFGIESGSSLYWTNKIWISPSFYQISTEVVAHIMYDKVNYYPYGRQDFCISSPNFHILLGAWCDSSHGCINTTGYSLVQTDQSCTIAGHLDSYVYSLFYHINYLSVNTLAEQIELQFAIQMVNHNSTPLLFRYMNQSYVGTSDRSASYITAYGLLENARHTQNIYDEISDLNEITFENNEAIITPYHFDSEDESFFGTFADLNPYGISTIVTSPLSFINSFDNACTPLNLGLFGETISLPCGDTLFWGRSDVSAFRTIWNILIGGSIVYMLLVKVFKTIEKLRDPQDDKVKVMNL